MKRFERICTFVLSVGLLVSALLLRHPVSAAQPDGYWPYTKAYQDAVASGKIEDIFAAGNALLDFYAQFPLNKDIAANSFNVYNYLYTNSIYEKRGDYEAAEENLKNLIKMADYAGIDGVGDVARAKMRKLESHAGLFAAVGDTSAPTVHYGAKNEPEFGVYLGRVLDLRDLQIQNKNEYADESVVSLYVNVGESTVGEFSWVLDQIDFSEKALHIALNFPKEGTTVAEINAGTHDENLKKNMQEIAALEQPVFLRIGAEMNIWTTPTEPKPFIDAYIRIAKFARELAPNAALIFSLNSSDPFGSDVYRMEDYYPGDRYVDWVGISLYYNTITDASDGEASEIWFGTGSWADPIASAAEIVEKFGDKKPIFITEGGSANSNRQTGEDLSAAAAVRIRKAYESLTMIYPQIKGIIYFDTSTSFSPLTYDLSLKPATEQAYNAAVASNPSYLHRLSDTAKTFVPLNRVATTQHSVLIYGYCDAHYSDALFADYTLDDAPLGSSDGSRFTYLLHTDSLEAGAHTLRVSFTDRNAFTQTLEYPFTKDADGTIRFADASTVFSDVAGASELQAEQAAMQQYAENAGGAGENAAHDANATQDQHNEADNDSKKDKMPIDWSFLKDYEPHLVENTTLRKPNTLGNGLTLFVALLFFGTIAVLMKRLF